MKDMKSKLLNISKKHAYLKKFYYFYNICIRNYKLIEKFELNYIYEKNK